jgi:DNA-binding response OmpR family regulator
VDEANGIGGLPPWHGATALVVGDDEAARESVGRRLRLLGFGVETAADFGQALRHCREYRVQLLVVAGELSAPGAGVLADVLSAAYPGLKVLAVSAAPVDTLPWKGVVADAPYLPTPFGLPQLARAVQAVLGKPREQGGRSGRPRTDTDRACSAADPLPPGGFAAISA